MKLRQRWRSGKDIQEELRGRLGGGYGQNILYTGKKFSNN